MFAVVSALIVGVSGFTSALLWVSSISAKADASIAQNLTQEERMNRQDNFTARQQDLLIDIRDRGIRTEQSIEIILKRVKNN